MIVGFTGTRSGMTEKQIYAIRTMLSTGGVTEAHHGDCIGGDEQFHELCVQLEIPVVIHPPVDPKLRAFCEVGMTKEQCMVLPPKPYLDRNQDIVIASELLYAAPRESEEPSPARGQGTWSTVRYARRLDHAVRVVWP